MQAAELPAGKEIPSLTIKTAREIAEKIVRSDNKSQAILNAHLDRLPMELKELIFNYPVLRGNNHFNLLNDLAVSDIKALKLALDLGVYISDINGWTPFHVAGNTNNQKVVDLLLEYKKNINARDNQQLTPLDLALLVNNTNSAEYLIKKGAISSGNQSLVKNLIMRRFDKSLQLLISHRLIDVNMIIDDKPLLNICLHNRLFLAFNALLQQGALINQETLEVALGPQVTDRFLPALVEPAVKQKIISAQDLFMRVIRTILVPNQILQKLLNMGADVNNFAEPNSIPLIEILQNNLLYPEEKEEIALFLINQGAQINRADQKGNTVLHLAVYHGMRQLVKELLAKGASVNVANNEGDTPLDFCKSKQIKTLLLKEGAKSGKE